MLPGILKNHILYKVLFKDSYSIMMMIDAETGTIHDVNKAALTFYQFSKKEMIGMNISMINVCTETEINIGMQTAGSQKPKYNTGHHKLKTGEIKAVDIYTRSMKFDKSNLTYVIVHDISEKTHILDALKKNQSIIRAMINATDSLVYLFDTKGNIINLNSPGALLFNKSPLEMIGKNFKIFFGENEFSKLTMLVDEVTKTQEPINYQKDRNGRCYDVNLYPVFNESNLVDRICVFANDISVLKMIEKVFSAVDTAGGLCHEMNQPLQVVLGKLELLKLSIETDDSNLELINTIISHTQKIAEITKKLTHITCYETKEYMKGTVFDIDRPFKIK